MYDHYGRGVRQRVAHRAPMRTMLFLAVPLPGALPLLLSITMWRLTQSAAAPVAHTFVRPLHSKAPTSYRPSGRNGTALQTSTFVAIAKRTHTSESWATVVIWGIASGGRAGNHANPPCLATRNNNQPDVLFGRQQSMLVRQVVDALGQRWAICGHVCAGWQCRSVSGRPQVTLRDCDRVLAQVLARPGPIDYRLRVDLDEVDRNLSLLLLHPDHGSNFRFLPHIASKLARVPRDLLRADRVQELQRVIGRVFGTMLDSYRGRDTITLAHAFAKAGTRDADLFDAIAARLLSGQDRSDGLMPLSVKGDAIDLRPSMGLLDARLLSNCAWAFAKVNVGHVALFTEIARRAAVLMPTFAAQHVANTVWAFARVHVDSAGLFEAAALHAVTTIDAFQAQEVANSAWAFAVLSNPHPHLFSAIAGRAQVVMPTLLPKHVAILAWAFATVRLSDDALFQALADRAASLIDAFVAVDLSMVAWAFARAAINDQDLFAGIGRAAIAQIESFGEQELSNLAWAFATLANVDDDLFRAIAQASLDKMDAFRAQGLANLAWSYATLAIPNDALLRAIARRAMAVIDTFNPQNVANLAWAFARLNVHVDGLFDAIARRSLAVVGAFSATELTMLASAFSAMSPGMHDDLYMVIKHRAVAVLETFDDHQRTLLSNALMRLTVRHDSPFQRMPVLGSRQELADQQRANARRDLRIRQAVAARYEARRATQDA